MNFLEKLNYLMGRDNLNKSTLSKACDIPYTTIDGWYKKGYEGLKLTTLRKLANYFKTSLDFWANDEENTLSIAKKQCKLEKMIDSDFTIITNPEEQNHIKKYRALDERGREIVDIVLDSQYGLIQAKKETSCGLSDEEIEKELESYKQELLAEQKGKTSSVSANIKGA